MGSAEWGSDSASFASTPRCRSRPPASASVAPPKPSSRTIGRPLARLPRVAAHETTPPHPLPRTGRSALAHRRLLFLANVAHQGQARRLRDLADRRPGGRRPPTGQPRHDARDGRGRPRQTHRSPIPRRQGRPRGGVDRPKIVCGFARPAAPHRAFRPGRRSQHRHAWPPGRFHHAHQRGRSGNRFPTGPVLRGASSPAPRARRPPPHQWSDRLPRAHSTAPPSAATKKTPGSWREPAARRAKSRMR